MVTYQDLQQIGTDEKDRMEFVLNVIRDHKNSDLFKDAVIADKYYRRQNETIMLYQKLLQDMSGKKVPDNFSANYKVPSNFLRRFITQEVQYLLGNGVAWNDPSTEDALGGDFDTRLQDAAKNALCGGVAFGFWNLDHVEVFKVLEFAPIPDEENGALMAGVRFWQINSTKPLRATFYEIDGYTDYIWESGKEGRVLQEKRPYVLSVGESVADGVEIYDGKNYPTFPIVPLWQPDKQSELKGLREGIDAYDLIKSGFANDIDDASQIYWIFKNAGGMDEVDMQAFLDTLRRTHAGKTDDEADVEAHTLEVPYQSREAILERISRDLYRDAMALDTDNLASGAVTATQIEAAYEPLNSKTDEFEFCVIEFVQGILQLAGIEDDPTFTRSLIVNRSEEIANVLQGAEYFDEEYVTRKLLDILGDGDQADDVLERLEIDEMERGGFPEEGGLEGLEDTEGLEEPEEPEEPVVEGQAEGDEEASAIEKILDMLRKLMEEL